MQMTKLPINVLVLSLWVSDLTGTCAGGLSRLQSGSEDQPSKAILRISERISEIADAFNYRLVRAYKVEPDEWDMEERRPLLINHSYYTLFSRDPDSLLDLGPMHKGVSSKRMSANILVFKDADLAGRELLRLRKKLGANIGARVVKADENGFEVRATLRSHVAVRHGANLVLLETDKQGETMTAIATKLKQASW
jgi:hypothetical protein